MDKNVAFHYSGAIEETIGWIRENDLILKIEEDLHAFLSFEIKFSDDKKKQWPGKLYLVESLRKILGEWVAGMQNYIVLACQIFLL